jgi:hypothetical protein
MKVVYAELEGTNYQFIADEIEKTLKWVETADVTPDFFGRVQRDLDQMWTRLAVSLINCKRPVIGFKAMVTNSALTVYPQV